MRDGEERRVSGRALDILGFGFLMLLIVAVHKNLASDGEDAMVQAEVDAMGEAEGNFMEAWDSASDGGSDNTTSTLQNIVLVLIDDQGYNDMGKDSTDLSVSCRSVCIHSFMNHMCSTLVTAPLHYSPYTLPALRRRSHPRSCGWQRTVSGSPTTTLNRCARHHARRL